MNLAHKEEHAGKVVKVYFDPDPTHPRKDWDNGTIMIHWHPRYDLGDKRVERCTADEVREEYQDRGDPVLAILPLYLYDHSGLSVSTGAFTCMWDSGQVGWVIITQSKSDEMGFPKEYTTEMYEDVIKAEVKTYDDYLTGQVFGYVVEGREGDELEACWGYVGDQEGCLSDGKRVAEDVTDPAIERAAKEEKVRQFPRLLAEIKAVGLTPEQVRDLCTSMDCSPEFLHEVLDSAEEEFESMKEKVS